MKTAAAFGALAVLMWTGPVSAQADDEHALRALIAGMDAGVEAPLTADAVVWNEGVAAPHLAGRAAERVGRSTWRVKPREWADRDHDSSDSYLLRRRHGLRNQLVHDELDT
jgi:hypothetical protein